MKATRIAGFSAAFVVKVTLAAAIGFLFLKWLGPKTGIPGLANAVSAL